MKIIFLLTLTLIFFTSCKKFIEVDNPIDKITSDKVFKDSSTATAALVGIYTKMGSVGLRIPIISTGAITIYTGLTSDELLYTSSVASETEFLNNSIAINNPIISSDIWRFGYNFIYHANAVIEGIENSETLSQSLANRLTGEAKFLRAYFHFALINLFGDVPLIVVTDYNQTSTIARTPVAQVYEQIIEDLKEAKQNLLEEYPASQRTRVNKWTACAMLSRVYLYTGKYELAEQEASLVINSGLYGLESNLNSVFINSSNETIWQLIPFATSLSTIEGFKFIPSSSATSLPTYPIRNELLNSFENGDTRKSMWTKGKTVASQTYYYPFKYKVRAISAGTPLPEYHILIRYAELFLIRAEARAKLNNLNGAIADINIIRERASLPQLPTSLDQPQVLTAVANERRFELFSECGHRWFDLKRRNEANSILGPLKPGWQSTDALFPIPQTEILSNPNLVQNPGY